ncbi:MAG: hypothetical protein C0407_13775 [Desulfobacca sp.]|nr:hypothetical protein [Desulfobacca sp.]
MGIRDPQGKLTDPEKNLISRIPKIEQFECMKKLKESADIIIAVNISKNIQNPQVNTLIDVILQSINVMGRELVIYKSRGYDVLIEPNVGDVDMTDFS